MNSLQNTPLNRLEIVSSQSVINQPIEYIICAYMRVPTDIQKHNSMIFHDQQCNFHDYLMHSFQPPLLVASSPS